MYSAPQGWSPEDNILYAYTPNDPYFATGSPVGFPGQWHLDKQTSVAVVDTQVQGAWGRNLTGQGVVIGIVDDSLQINHPDLSPNYLAADSRDFGQNDGDPSPVHPNIGGSPGDNHGTSVAGVAAARGGNGIGGTGAAPMANLAGLRIDFPNQTQQMFIDATLYHSSGANTTIKIKNHSYGTSIPYSDRTAQANATITSHNAGTIHVFAAGNERSAHGGILDVNGNGFFDPDIDFAIDGDANKKHLQRLQETIDVAALASTGAFSTYSNWGANMWVTAPSNSFRTGELGITTTDRTGGAAGTGGYNFGAGGADGDGFPDLDYNSTFGGTSSAAPLVSGILALAKEAQPALNTRFAKHLLARTSDVVDPLDASPQGGWVTNAAGYEFNENYGFGVINADKLTSEAVKFSAVTPLVTESVPTTVVNATIPDANLTGITRTFNLSTAGALEEVEVRLNVNHSWRGDVEAFLTSPLGTVSRLMYRNAGDSFNNINWTFLTNAFWGENPVGTWSLMLRDVFAQDTGVWSSFSVLAKTGTLVPVPEPSTIALMLGVFGLLGAGGRGKRQGA
jgi:subtilisin family serine protease